MTNWKERKRKRSW